MFVSSASSARSTPSSAASRSPITRAFAWSSREPVDVVIERVEPGGGQHAGLAHRAAEHPAVADERGDVVARAREHRADGAAEPLGERERDEVERRGERRRVVAARRGRVEQPGAVEVGRDAVLARGRADPLELGAVPHEPALAVLRVLDLDERRRRVQQVVARVARGEERVGGEAPVRPDLGELDPADRRRRAGLVPHGVALGADDHVVARAAEELERELVGHRPRRDEQRRLLAEQGGDPLLQRDDARVLAVLVVADLGRGDRGAHRLGRARDGVGAEVDHRLSSRSRAARSARGPAARACS